MTDTPSPAPRDDELRETLDLMATAVASMSNRIDGLTTVAKKQIEVSTEARIAAFAARDQTNPKKYGELIGQTVDGRIADSLNRLNKAAGTLLSGVERSNASFQETTTAHSDTLRLIADLREKQRQDRRWLPWVGLGGIVLALVLTVTLPRFLASTPTACALIGATWTATSTGVNACVFYQE
ncbi:hypothetical protein [Sedimentitalea nanhaiensis]|uniref:Uncharacterized protein n=1 Tax=Sedimentitalea nanhaiensis TaxID=999627 RepID=A0A1I7E4S0_9RHOB|nr:hypothetical protein [Sedimentitalea nanhaiensis]SFU18926.1 hypothetical protein SAMN05216236_14425 [Sedimentitalea nanhaiensis]